MKNRIVLLDIAIVALIALATAVLYAHIPATIPVHWDINGEVNGYGPRAFLFFDIALMAAIVVLWVVLPALSPQRFTVDEFAATWWHMSLIVVGMLAFFHCLLLCGALSLAVPMTDFLVGGVAVFIGLLGNLMGKVRRNFWIGIRTPWTLASERVWYATHRVAAKTMVSSAFLAVACAVIGLPTAVSLALPIAGTVFPAVYSWWLYRRIEGGAGA